jgi:hypothetical protein
MFWLRLIIIYLALSEAGWMALDGSRALIVGDYVTPSSGEYAGQLGPWSRLVSAVGIPPRSTLMKAIFVGYGLIWLLITAAFAFSNAPWTWYAMFLAALFSLWYLPIGTAFGLLQLILLLILRYIR